MTSSCVCSFSPIPALLGFSNTLLGDDCYLSRLVFQISSLYQSHNPGIRHFTHSCSDWHPGAITPNTHHLLRSTLGINLTKKDEGIFNEVNQVNMFRLTFLLGFLFLILFSFDKHVLGIHGARHCPELLREAGKQNRLLEVTRQAATHQSPVQNWRGSQKGLKELGWRAQHPHAARPSDPCLSPLQASLSFNHL